MMQHISSHIFKAVCFRLSGEMGGKGCDYTLLHPVSAFMSKILEENSGEFVILLSLWILSRLNTYLKK